MCQLGFRNIPQLPENAQGGDRNVFVVLKSGVPSAAGLRTQWHGENNRAWGSAIEKEKKLDRQNRIIHSGIKAERRGGCSALKAPP